LKIENVRHSEVSIVITEDEPIRALNREYRGFDKPTDVLSFPQRSDSAFVVPAIRGAAEELGDVIVSVETAERQAAEQGHSLETELSLLVIHGILHLLGHEDESESGAVEMRRRERGALRLLGSESAGLVERARV
jgi:probable rRNA maturation factor